MRKRLQAACKRRSALIHHGGISRKRQFPSCFRSRICRRLHHSITFHGKRPSQPQVPLLLGTISDVPGIGLGRLALIFLTSSTSLKSALVGRRSLRYSVVRVCQSSVPQPLLVISRQSESVTDLASSIDVEAISECVQGMPNGSRSSRNLLHPLHPIDTTFVNTVSLNTVLLPKPPPTILDAYTSQYLPPPRRLPSTRCLKLPNWIGRKPHCQIEILLKAPELYCRGILGQRSWSSFWVVRRNIHFLDD